MVDDKYRKSYPKNVTVSMNANMERESRIAAAILGISRCELGRRAIAQYLQEFNRSQEEKGEEQAA